MWVLTTFMPKVIKVVGTRNTATSKFGYLKSQSRTANARFKYL